MPADESRSDVQIIATAYEERVKELFKVFAETLYTGEPERDAVARFKRALLSVRRVRALALDAAKEADTP
jgi:hypothetical protein